LNIPLGEWCSGAVVFVMNLWCLSIFP
jgi:hypothetical protein